MIQNVFQKTGNDMLHTHPTYAVKTYPTKTGVGFVAGTCILSQDGEIPVEFLSSGDRIITRDAGFVQLDQISHSRQMVPAIRFAAGSLGHLRPEQDLILPHDQQVLIRDWRAKALFGTSQAMVRAADLIDDEFICDLGPRSMMLYQLHFSSPHVVYAGGLEVAGIAADTADLRTAA